MSKVRLTLSVSDSHLKRLDQVARDAKAAGLEIEQQLDGIGVITGSIEADRIAHLHRIAGVDHVEPDRTVGIAPPGSPVQ
jgi:hypothetical protein